MGQPAMSDILSQAESLLKKVRPASDIILCNPLSGGRNNRVYRLETTWGPLLLKKYHLGGDWDRMAAESRFLRFCETADVRRVPRLCGEDAGTGLALHTWIDGERPVPGKLSAGDMAAAAAFVGELAAASRMPDTGGMPLARDACRSPEDMVRSLRVRLAQLEAALLADSGGTGTAEALAFFRDWLVPAWERTRQTLSAGVPGRNMRRRFSSRTLLASPSDFGFHNALRVADGGLRFVDFEYAGVDSAVKLIGDFICQADYAPPESVCEKLASSVCADPIRAAELAEWVWILLPLFRVKFCCIVLNDFKSADAERRDFSTGETRAERREKQLTKAKTYFEDFMK